MNNQAQQRQLLQMLSSYVGSPEYQGKDITAELYNNFSAEELAAADTRLVGFDGTYNDQRDAFRSIAIQVQGHATLSDTLYLNPYYGIKESDNGHIVSGKGTGGNAFVSITIQGGTITTKDFSRALEQVPMSMMGFRIQSSDSGQLAQPVLIEQYEDLFFASSRNRQLIPTAYQNERDQRTDMVTMNTPVNFDRNTSVKYQILGGKTVTILLAFGARLDWTQKAQNAINAALTMHKSARKNRFS